MPKLSKKGIELPTSPIRKLVCHSDDAKARGIDVLHLNIGQPDISAPKEAINAIRNTQLKLLPYGHLKEPISTVKNYVLITKKMKLKYHLKIL